MEKVIEVLPYTWNGKEALNSGKLAFRIGVTQINNPFKGSLGDMWSQGWQDAANNIPYSTKRVEFSEDRDASSSDRRRKGNFRKSGDDRGRSTKSYHPR